MDISEIIDTIRRSLVASEMLNNTDTWHKRMIAAIKWLDGLANTIATQAARIAELETDDADRARLVAQVSELAEWKTTATRDLKMTIEANKSQQRVIRNEREHAERLVGENTRLVAQVAQLEAELVGTKQSRDLLAHALLTAVDNIEDGGVDKWTLNIVDEVDLAFSIVNKEAADNE